MKRVEIAGVLAAWAAWAPLAQAQPDSPAARCEALASVERPASEADAEAAVTACVAATAAQPGSARLLYLQGRALLAVGRDPEALAAFLAAGEGGSGDGMVWAGRMTQSGRGGPKDPAKAAELYRRALASGHAPAATYLGYLHRDGNGVAKDVARAVQLFRQAGEAGSPEADVALGALHQSGDGVPKDPARAAALYRRAAERGSAMALANLGVMASEGEGMPRDPAGAMRLYRQAAELGNPQAMYNIALAYERGEGVPVDTAQAEAWYRKSMAAGDATDAANNLAYLLVREKRNLDEAESLVAPLVKEMSEPDADLMDTLGAVYLGKGRLTDAALLFRGAVHLKPSRAIHRDHLGDAYAALGLRDDARLEWARALALRTRVDPGPEPRIEDLRRKLAAPPVQAAGPR